MIFYFNQLLTKNLNRFFFFFVLFHSTPVITHFAIFQHTHLWFKSLHSLSFCFTRLLFIYELFVSLARAVWCLPFIQDTRIVHRLSRLIIRSSRPFHHLIHIHQFHYSSKLASFTLIKLLLSFLLIFLTGSLIFLIINAWKSTLGFFSSNYI